MIAASMTLDRRAAGRWRSSPDPSLTSPCAALPSRRFKRTLRERPASREAGAEGATAPETLRQTDRRGMKLWKAAAPQGIAHRRSKSRPHPAMLRMATLPEDGEG